MEELTEVITAAECHPHQCNVFVYSSSKGTIRLCDMRSAALCDRHSKCEYFKPVQSLSSSCLFFFFPSFFPFYTLPPLYFPSDGESELSAWECSLTQCPFLLKPDQTLSLKGRGKFSFCLFFYDHCLMSAGPCVM